APALAAYQPLHAAHAELRRRLGDRSGAAGAYRRAIELSANAVERDELERRLAALAEGEAGEAGGAGGAAGAPPGPPRSRPAPRVPGRRPGAPPGR
ncbi:MAG TPA: hypothetical protein VFI47_10980, partial [Acidimicrobiales bacterium]|nr:hypothetical protein [Acidimicrobiales bacterium]